MKTCLYLQVYNENPTEVGVHGGGTKYIYLFTRKVLFEVAELPLFYVQLCSLL